MSKLSEYVKKGKEKKTGLGEVMERRKNRKLQQLEEAEIDAAIAEAKSKISKSQATQQPLQPGQAQNFASLLLAGRPPQEVKEILGSLTKEEMDNLAYIASTMNKTKFADFRGFLRQPTTGGKEILEAVKTGVEVTKNQTTEYDLKGIADIFKAGVEAAKAQNPPQSNEVQKVMLEEMKALRSETTRLKEATLQKQIDELKKRPTALQEVDYIMNHPFVKRALEDKGHITEMDLKIEEMKQKERLQNKQLDWEQEKVVMDKEGTAEVLKTVKGIFEGPVGETIKNIGSAGADRVRGGSAQQGKQLVRAQCPSCKGVFLANPELSQITCPQCGETLSKEAPPQSEPLIREVAPQPKATEKKGEPKRAAKRKKT